MNLKRISWTALALISTCFASGATDIVQGKSKSSMASAYSAKPARNKSYSGKLVISRANVYYRAFLRFDLKGISAENVKDAAILLYSTKQYYKRPCRINVYEVASKWNEKYLTYYNRDKDAKWNKPGGDIKELPAAFFDVNAEFINGWVCIKSKQLTELVKLWLQNPDTNNGVMLRTAFRFRGQTMKFFADKFYKHADKMPKLIISDKPINPADYGVITPLQSAKNLLNSKLERIKKVLPAKTAQALQGDFRNVHQSIELLQVPDKKSIEAITADIGKLHIKALKTGFPGTTFKAWNLSPWDKLDKFAYPAPGTAKLDAEMLGNEYLEQSLAVTNTSGKKLVLNVKLSTGSFPAENIVKRASYWVKAIKPKAEQGPGKDNFSWIDDALPRLQKDKYMILKPGETRRLWLTVNSNKVSSGTYDLKINISDTFGNSSNVPFKLKVHAVKLDKDPELNVYTYAYLNRKSTSSYAETAIKDLQAHYQNTYVLNLIPKYTPQTGKADYSHIVNYVKKVPEAKKILFFWNCESGKIPFCPAKGWGSAQWSATLKKVINGWYTELKKAGFDKNRVVMYPFDETYNNKCCGRIEYEALKDVARELHKIDPAILVFADPVGFTSRDMKAMEALKKNINIWAPVQELYHKGGKKGWPHPYTYKDKLSARKFFAAEQKAGKQLWTYQCDGPNKLLGVNNYFRQYPWRGWFFGATGLGIWSYNDIRGDSSWSDADNGDFSMIYELRDAPSDITTEPFEPLIPSRRWEAFRAGIQDYMLLQMLIRKGIPKDKLKNIVNEVLKNSDESQTFTIARKRLLQKLFEK